MWYILFFSDTKKFLELVWARMKSHCHYVIFAFRFHSLLFHFRFMLRCRFWRIKMINNRTRRASVADQLADVTGVVTRADTSETGVRRSRLARAAVATGACCTDAAVGECPAVENVRSQVHWNAADHQTTYTSYDASESKTSKWVSCRGGFKNLRRGSPPFPLLPLPLKVGPLKPARGFRGTPVSSPSGVRGGATAENEFGAL